MRAICFFITLLLFSVLNCTTIEKINSISEGKKVFDYDFHNGSILQYNNRLIVRNQFSIEEYLMKDDGGLESISLFDSIETVRGYARINDGKYYSFVTNFELQYCRIEVYDITTTPMRFIKTLNTDISSWSRPAFLFYDEKLLITDYDKGNTQIFNTQNLEFEGYIEGLYGGQIYIRDNILIEAYLHQIDDTIKIFFRFSEIINLNNNETRIISELYTPDWFTGIIDVTFTDNLMCVAGYGGVWIVDIQDLEKPCILHEIKLNYVVYAAIYSHDYLFTSTDQGDLHTYSIFEGGDVLLIFNKKGIAGGSRNLHYNEPYLYFNHGDALRGYDVSNNFKEVYFEKKSNQMLKNEFTASPTHDDLYYSIHDQENDYVIDIYSAISDSLLCTIYFHYNIAAYQIHIENDLIYLLTMHSNRRPLYSVLKIDSYGANLLSSVSLSHSGVYNFNKTENQVFFKNFYSDLHHVYDIDGENIKYNKTYSGYIQNRFSNQPKDYILNHNTTDELFIRDINDYDNVLMTIPAKYSSNGSIDYIKDNYLLMNFQNSLVGQVFLCNFDLQNNNSGQMYQFPIGRMHAYGDIFTYYDITNDTSIFYTLKDGKPVRIGDKKNIQQVEYSFFYPAKRKMVELTKGGVWVYDVNFSFVSNTDEVVIAQPTALLGNYPNPFNPSTTIKFRIENSELRINTPSTFSLSTGEGRGEGLSAVKIEIFNIKGQKIRTLVNGNYSSGEHSVVWNGTDEQNNPVSSGIYFYRLTTNNYTETKKMIMLK